MMGVSQTPHLWVSQIRCVSLTPHLWLSLIDNIHLWFSLLWCHSLTLYLKNMRFFVLPIFDGVILDRHLIFGGCWRRAWLKYWMPIHYDTIGDGQKKSSFILIFVRIVLFLFFIGRIYLSKISLHQFISIIWIITPLIKTTFQPQNQNHRMVFICNTQCSHILNTQLPHVIAEGTVHLYTIL